MNFVSPLVARAPTAPVFHHVVQHSGRLCIAASATGEVIYFPPNFLASFIRGPEDLEPLADALNRGERYIDAVMAFETACGSELHR